MVFVKNERLNSYTKKTNIVNYYLLFSKITHSILFHQHNLQKFQWEDGNRFISNYTIHLKYLFTIKLVQLTYTNTFYCQID